MESSITSQYGQWCTNFKRLWKKGCCYTLEGMVEFDEGYFTIETSKLENSKGKTGRCAVEKQNVTITAESFSLKDNETGKKSKHCGYSRAKVLKTHKK